MRLNTRIIRLERYIEDYHNKNFTPNFHIFHSESWKVAEPLINELKKDESITLDVNGETRLCNERDFFIAIVPAIKRVSE